MPLHRAVHGGGPVLLAGPRGSGKTTVLRNEFPKWTYLTMEDQRDRRLARSDPEGFVARLRGPVIIDDVHRAPELVTQICRLGPSRSILMVSSRRLDVPLPTFRLYYPTRAEREGRPALPLGMLGHFVPKRTQPGRDVPPALPAGLPERDIQELVQVRDLERFTIFYERAFERSGEILDRQELARSAGISRTTAVRWLAALDACFLTVYLQPCGTDFGRRVVKSPKLHFLASPKFASVVVSEIFRNAMHTGLQPDLRYWRDSNGLEIPLVIAIPGAEPVPVSITESPNPTHEIRLQRWMALAGTRSGALISPRAPATYSGRALRYTLADL